MSKTYKLMKQHLLLLFVFVFLCNYGLKAQQHTVARKWNESLLEAIRSDFARPTVHARNLFHTSILMYDAWSIYTDTAIPYMLSKNIGSFKCEFEGITIPSNIKSAQEETMSYAVYRLLNHRFENSPGAEESLKIFDDLMDELKYDKAFISTDYSKGSFAALGNAMAACMIEYGLLDGSNEVNDYVNIFYEPVNDPLAPITPGNPDITDPNRWQPLALEVFIGQSGVVLGEFPDFLGPEWGTVKPFSLSEDDLTKYERAGNEYWVYNDPGTPPNINFKSINVTEDLYKWNFALVSKWSSHLDPSDGVMLDISPASIGNIKEFPNSFDKFDQFYNEDFGGDTGVGRNQNPVTNLPYTEQIVPRGDYGRVLAEFWADGPDSETPPGHWYTLLNYVNDHPLVIKKFRGEGDILSDLEWDVKSYFILGGGMHDAAISAWGIKGWYDYIRPISAIRFMADKGQSSDPNEMNYHEDGIPLTPGLIEIVKTGDPLAGINDTFVGKVKLFSWKGPDYINDPETDEAGVGWILAANWWPYQRPSFVTPPFAGYISGHSTFSRAAAEILTLLTGDEYFPGGMGEFLAEKNKFLVFEEGPSVDVTLQWATYRDASDQCSLSRIWGGIHPPADDIPGRIIGEKIGNEAFVKAETYFNGILTSINKTSSLASSLNVYPNPVDQSNHVLIQLNQSLSNVHFQITDLNGRIIFDKTEPNLIHEFSIPLNLLKIQKGIYIIVVKTKNESISHKLIIN